MSSPCNGVCKVEDGICIGCGRTLDEIFQAGLIEEEEDE